jgi:hypothetical protein
MFKRFLITVVALVSISAFSSIAWASVVGSWDINGTQTVKVSIKKYKTQTIKIKFYDEFTFYDDGYFEMVDMDGDWVQKKNKFTVYLDPESVSQYFADNLGSELDSDVSVQVTKITFTGTEQKNGTIKGSFKLFMTFYIEDYDLTGKVTVSGSFKGTRSEEMSMSSVKEEESNQLPESILDTIEEEVDNALER